MFHRKAFAVVTVVVFALVLSVGVAHAQDPDPEADPVAEALVQFTAAMGLGAAVSTIVQALKAFRVIPDGMGGQVALVLNMLVYGVATVAGFFGIDAQGDIVKQALAVIGELIVIVLTSILYFKSMRESGVFGFGPRSS